jgi:histidine ammonia-lyase
MAAAQALDLREFQPGRGVDMARQVIREKVAFLDEDRSLAPDHTCMQELTRTCRILEKVEEEVGDLSNAR